MARYKLYRHPQRGSVVLPAEGFGALLADLFGQDERLLRAGYRDAGIIDASNARAALAQGQPPPAAKAVTRAATVRQTAAAPPTPRRAPASAPTRPVSTRAAGWQPASPASKSAPAASRPASAPAASPMPARPMPPDLEKLLRDGLARAPLAKLRIGLWLIAGLVILSNVAPKLHLSKNVTPDDALIGRYSEWLNFDQLSRYTQGVDAQRYRVDAVEGRWHGGQDQCRVRYAQTPSYPHHWYWWCSQGHADFERLKAQYAAQGYTLVQEQTYARPDGDLRYSGAWFRSGRPDSPDTPDTP